MIKTSRLKNAGSILTVPKLMKNLGMQNPLLIYKRLALQEKLSHKDLIKLGWKEISKRVLHATKTARSPCDFITKHL